MNLKQLYDEYHAATDDDFHEKREPFLAAVESLGVTASLEALGFPTDRSAVWYNVNTGSEETLDDMLTYGIVGPIAKEDEPTELGFVLENWLPKTCDPNPIIARSLAISEASAMRILADQLKAYIEETQTADAFVERVADQGGTMEDGYYTNAPKAKGKVRVELHDGRAFTFSLRELWRSARQSFEQPSLFSL